MAFTTHLLVVANRTVDSPELLDALRQRAEPGPIHVTMLAPSTYAERAQAQRRLERAAANLEAAGIEAEAMLGDADPIVAVQEAWNPGRYDEVVVSHARRRLVAMAADRPARTAWPSSPTARCATSRCPCAGPRRRSPQPPPERRPMLERVASLMRSGSRSGAA